MAECGAGFHELWQFAKRSPSRNIIKIPMQIQSYITYHAPEGDDTGTIIETRIHRDTRNGQPRECLRHTIVSDLEAPDMITEYHLRADYWSTQMNDFARASRAILGDEFRELIDADKNIIEAKLDLFVGKRVRYTVVHEHRPGHEHAFRKVINLRPLRDKLAA